MAYPYNSPGSSIDATTSNLLDPNWGPAQYDTEKRGAELAYAGGYSGSPLAGYQTGRMRAADIERRAALANELLSGETNRKLGVGAQANQVSQYNTTLSENKRQFDAQEAQKKALLDLQKQEAARAAQQQAWQQQQAAWQQGEAYAQRQRIAAQAAENERYMKGYYGANYSPLPQYK
jgi:hypothetical protein